MDVIVKRPAALDVHKEQVTACVRVADEHGARVSHVAEFKTTVRGLLVLGDLEAGLACARGSRWRRPACILGGTKLARNSCASSPRPGCVDEQQLKLILRDPVSRQPNRFVRCAS
jgi:hypothetical protein